MSLYLSPADVTRLHPHLTLRQAAEHLGVSAKQVRRLIAAGKLAVLATGTTARGYRISAEELARFARDNTIREAPPCPSGRITAPGAIVSSATGGSLREALERARRRLNSKPRLCATSSSTGLGSRRSARSPTPSPATLSLLSSPDSGSDGE